MFNFVQFLLRETSHKIYHFKVYSSVVFGIFTILYNYDHYKIPEYIHHPKKQPISGSSHSQTFHPSATSNH